MGAEKIEISLLKAAQAQKKAELAEKVSNSLKSVNYYGIGII